MRKIGVVVLVGILMTASFSALAELQTVQVGGEIRIRGNYWMNAFTSPNALETRWPASFLPARAIGDVFGGQSILSPFAWDSSDSNDVKFVEQRTRLCVKADFTDDVAATIELDSYDIWGEDFRSNYVTGADSRAVSTDDVEVFQAFIEMHNIAGQPLSVFFGRREYVFGKGILVGNSTTNSNFTGHSIDAIHAMYKLDMVTLNAIWGKAFEASPAEEDGDCDLYGIYVMVNPSPAFNADAYWLLARDARSVNDTNFIAPLEWVEDILGLDDYDVTNLHNFGLRLYGEVAGFDYEMEAVYQMGEAGQVGALFSPSLYGDDDAEFDNWGGDLTVGYSIDMVWQPRVYVKGAFYSGNDNRDLNWWEWVNPFYKPEASMGFMRLCSGIEYSKFMDTNAQMSNFWMAGGGMTVKPTESLEIGVDAAYFEVVDPFARPQSITLGEWTIPINAARPFRTMESAEDLGWEVGLWATYAYTEDLTFEAGWSHLFVGNGLEDGSYTNANGLGFNGGSDGDDADYLYFETKVKF
ncbi:MAG: alginate export family protein [bacterium]|nr:alginate export family protein [bacterium]